MMRITNSLIKQVVVSVAGEDVVPLVMAIKDKKNVSEFKIAELINEQINITRNMLYRLFDHNLVHFIRKKDRKKGWYIYYWTFNTKYVKFLIIKVKKQRLERLGERLMREQQGQFYLCPNTCMRLDFEQSMNFQFKCAECGSLLNVHDNTRAIENIELEIKEISQFLKETEKESKIVSDEGESAESGTQSPKKPARKSAKTVKGSRTKKATTKKSATKKSPKKKAVKKKATRKKTSTKKATTKKATTKKAAAKKATTKRATSKKSAATKTTTKKATSKKSAATKTTAKRAQSKRGAAEKASDKSAETVTP